MKKTGGCKFNCQTKQWEGEPIRYIEFHCTREEFKHVKVVNLVRDFLRSGNYYKEPEYFTVRGCIEDAVKDIICERYSITLLEHVCSDGWYDETLKVDVSGAKFPLFVTGVTGFPKLDDTLEYVNEIDLVRIVASVIKAIYSSMDVYGKDYFDKFVSGKYLFKSYSVQINKLD